MSFFRLLAACLALAAFAAPLPAQAAGRFLAPAQESASAGIAADQNGGLHAAFTGYDGPTGDVVYYRHCAADCADTANWASVTLAFVRPISVQVAADPAGRPRLLITSYGDGKDGADRLYSYAECDGDCLAAANWRIAPIATSTSGTFTSLFQFRVPDRSFVVDDEGHPHFVYVDANYLAEPDHYGTFHLTCAAACSEPGNWSDTNLAVRIPDRYTTESWDQVALAVAPGGKLRLLASVYAIAPDGSPLEKGLYYYECDSGCGDLAGWRRTRVIDTGYGSYPNPTWDLEVLPDGRPRAIFFTGTEMEQKDLDHQLLYLWCDAACDNDANWYGNAISARGDGESPDLALTAEGHPRVAALGAHGDLGYFTCDEDCESSEGKWDLKLQDATTEAAADRPTAMPFTCDAEIWNGFMPRLALAGDRPWFAWDLVVEGRCLYKEYDSDPVPTYEFHEIWRGGRLSWL